MNVPRLSHFRRRWAPALAALIGGGAITTSALTATGAAAAGTAPAATAASRDEEPPRWAEMNGAQRSALKPLERDWASLDAARKQKWLDIAGRFPRMSADEQRRVQARMTEWAAMSPAQRSQARLQFKEAEQVAPTGRQAQWEAYQALSPEQKRQLLGQAARSANATSAPGHTVSADVTAGDGAQQKSKIVPNPSTTARPKPVAPALVQAAPGATTSLVSKPPSPPAHQQAGLPKIAGSANFIDPATLLPRRGPQGAAVTAATASAPLPRP